MLKQNRHWLDRLADRADLPGEADVGQTVVELAGDRRVLIEHHRGVIQYGRNQICVRVRYGTVLVCGCELELARMTKQQLVICGRIDRVELCRRGK